MGLVSSAAMTTTVAVLKAKAENVIVEEVGGDCRGRAKERGIDMPAQTGLVIRRQIADNKV